MGGERVRRAWCWAAMKVRDLRGWLDREVVGEYDTYTRTPRGTLFKLQLWMMERCRDAQGARKGARGDGHKRV